MTPFLGQSRRSLDEMIRWPSGRINGTADFQRPMSYLPERPVERLYDLGGELNHKPEHCEAGVPGAICRFRENEGVNLSYVKKGADLNHPNRVVPDWQQLYIGWTENGEPSIVQAPPCYHFLSPTKSRHEEQP